MKFITTLLLTIAIAFTAHAGDKKKADWPALKVFHTVMAQTFHPSEEGNLEPVRTRAAELVEKAEALSTGKVPKEYNSPKMKDAVLRLQMGTKSIQDLVNSNASDDELKAGLVTLHDNFHEIMGLCQKGDGHEGAESHEGHGH